MREKILFLTIGVFASFSKEYNENPDKFYRDPCPESRPSDLCNALDEYVWRKDENFRFEFVEENRNFEGVVAHTYRMFSQKWLNETYYEMVSNSNGQIWEHFVQIWIPDDLDESLAHASFLTIGGGNWRSTPSYGSTETEFMRVLAKLAKVPTVYISDVPNGPMKFFNDWMPERKADQMVPWTWRKYLDEKFPEFQCWFPMVKASLRAMDIAEEIIKEKTGAEVQKWSVSGGSKRGWTTWLTAAVDPERVNFIAPTVCDFVNFRETVHRWLRNLGGIQVAQADYWLDQIHKFVDEPHFADYADPFLYNERLTMVKYIVSGTLDYFWSPDDSWSFFDQLKGTNYMRLLPNSEHSTAGAGIFNQHYLFGIRQLFIAVNKNYPLPKISFTRSTDPVKKTGRIDLTVTDEPIEIYGWVGDTRSKTRKDFRIFGVRNNEEWSDPDQNLHLPYPEYHDQKFVELYEDIERAKILTANFTAENDMLSQRLDPQDIILLKNLQLQGNFWKRIGVTRTGRKTFTLELNEASNAFRGFFIEVAFAGADSMGRFQFTTEVNIIPEKDPFDDCIGEECASWGLI